MGPTQIKLCFEGSERFGTRMGRKALDVVVSEVKVSNHRMKKAPVVKPRAEHSNTDPRVNSIRLLFRSLAMFRSIAETDSVYEITTPNGVVWSLWDIEYLYREAMRRPTGNRNFDREHPTLPLRQQQAIELFLVLNIPEDQAAVIMGLSKTNPVGLYATSGIHKLLRFLDEGRLPRFSAGAEAMLAIA